ncbi:MAG: hypothetical protein J5978_02005 [Spirochaetaceae bacterium]|nr:hypothetical protein [Spirochaetaceae bacterium]MBP3562340.1 hypothetical protein [Treponema sp.]
MKIVSKFSKSLIISLFVIGISIFTISSCDNTSYTDASGNNEDDNYCQPYDVTLGNGNYFVHCFEGEGTSATYYTMAKDMNYYLGKGETYVMDLVDKFSESLQDRPAAQAYFNEFIHAQKSNEFQRLNENGKNPYSFDNTISGISVSCEPIFENMIRNIDTNRDRSMFITCYQTITNEAYKYGLGTGRYGSSSQMNHYEDVREDIEFAWTSKTINNPFDINDDIDNQNCRQITNELDSLLKQAANNIGNDVTANDLRQVINISTTANSLTAMHSRSASALKHTSCYIKLNIVDKIDNLANEMYKAEKQQTQELGL